MVYVTGGGPLDFRECSPSKFGKGSNFSDSFAGFLRKTSSPISKDDFRARGLRGAASDVLCMEERTVPWDLPVEFAVEGGRDLLFGICKDGLEGIPFENEGGL